MWYFHATAHEKGPCNGAGGTIKRMVRGASFQMISDDRFRRLPNFTDGQTKILLCPVLQSCIETFKTMNRQTNF